LYVRTASL